MKFATSYSHSKSVFFTGLLCAIALLSTSCGSKTSSQAVPTGYMPDTNEPISDISGISPALFTLMSGTYRGKITGDNETFQELQQNYTLALSERTIQSRRYASVQFRSSGALGNFDFDIDLGSGLTNYFGQYSLASSAILVPGLSSSHIQLLMTFAVATDSNGKQVPAQPMIRIMDCGFSQNACTVDLKHVWFAGSL